MREFGISRIICSLLVFSLEINTNLLCLHAQLSDPTQLYVCKAQFENNSKQCSIKLTSAIRQLQAILHPIKIHSLLLILKQLPALQTFKLTSSLVPDYQKQYKKKIKYLCADFHFNLLNLKDNAMIMSSKHVLSSLLFNIGNNNTEISP